MFHQRRFVLLACVAALSLTGCGTKGLAVMPAGLATIQAAPQAASVITVTHTSVASPLVANNAANAAPIALPANLQHPTVSTLALAAEVDMTQDEAAADAQSQGYSVQDLASSDLGAKFSNDGTVRKVASGYALEVTSGFFHKTTTVYPLSASGDLLAKLQANLDQKVDLTGVVDKSSNTVVVSAVKHDISLGFLTNWLTRGKISGRITDVNGNVIAGAQVVATSAQGFEFDDASGPDGVFVLKTLLPGTYTVKVDAPGYTEASCTFTVKAMKNDKAVGVLTKSSN